MVLVSACAARLRFSHVIYEYGASWRRSRERARRTTPMASRSNALVRRNVRESGSGSTGALVPAGQLDEAADEGMLVVAAPAGTDSEPEEIDVRQSASVMRAPPARPAGRGNGDRQRAPPPTAIQVNISTSSTASAAPPAASAPAGPIEYAVVRRCEACQVAVALDGGMLDPDLAVCPCRRAGCLVMHTWCMKRLLKKAPNAKFQCTACGEMLETKTSRWTPSEIGRTLLCFYCCWPWMGTLLRTIFFVAIACALASPLMGFVGKVWFYTRYELSTWQPDATRPEPTTAKEAWSQWRADMRAKQALLNWNTMLSGFDYATLVLPRDDTPPEWFFTLGAPHFMLGWALGMHCCLWAWIFFKLFRLCQRCCCADMGRTEFKLSTRKPPAGPRANTAAA